MLLHAQQLSDIRSPNAAAFQLKATFSFEGDDLETVQGNCGACHSADYVQTQPQGPAFKKVFWEAEVTKMIKVYGAPIDEKDVPKIVEYLTATY